MLPKFIFKYFTLYRLIVWVILLDAFPKTQSQNNSYVFTASGYWRLSSFEPYAISCPYGQDACIGGFNISGIDLCASKFEGLLCAQSISNHYIDFTYRDSMHCNTEESVGYPFTYLPLGIIGLIVMISRIGDHKMIRSARSNWTQKTSILMNQPLKPNPLQDRRTHFSVPSTGNDLKSSSTSSIVFANVPILRQFIKLKILVTSMQILGSIPNSLSISMPFESTSKLLQIFNLLCWTNLQSFPFSCYFPDIIINYHNIMELATFIPLLVIISALLLFIIQYQFAYLFQSDNDSTAKQSKLIIKYGTLIFFFVAINISSMSSLLFGSFLCINVDPGHLYPHINYSVLWNDVSIQCQSSDYSVGILWAGIAIFFYLMLLPGIQWLALSHYRVSIIHQQIKLEQWQSMDQLQQQQANLIEALQSKHYPDDETVQLQDIERRYHQISQSISNQFYYDMHVLHRLLASHEVAVDIIDYRPLFPTNSTLQDSSASEEGVVPEPSPPSPLNSDSEEEEESTNEESSEAYHPVQKPIEGKDEKDGQEFNWVDEFLVAFQPFFATLYVGYKWNYWHWELIETAYRVVMVAVLPIIPLESDLKALLGLSISIIKTWHQTVCNPYLTKSDQTLSSLANYQLVIFYVLLLTTHTIGQDTDGLTNTILSVAFYAVTLMTPVMACIQCIHSYSTQMFPSPNKDQPKQSSDVEATNGCDEVSLARENKPVHSATERDQVSLNHRDIEDWTSSTRSSLRLGSTVRHSSRMVTAESKEDDQTNDMDHYMTAMFKAYRLYQQQKRSEVHEESKEMHQARSVASSDDRSKRRSLKKQSALTRTDGNNLSTVALYQSDPVKKPRNPKKKVSGMVRDNGSKGECVLQYDDVYEGKHDADMIQSTGNLVEGLYNLSRSNSKSSGCTYSNDHSSITSRSTTTQNRL